MKIAIASSGLGHVARGIETWALDTANALHRRGVDVTLFAAGHVPADAPLVTLPCIRRRTPLSNLIVRLMPGFTWRWGLKDGYGIEQLTFWRHLLRHLNAGAFDILHVQDPMLARWCRKARISGRTATRVILAHGTEEPLTFLSQFEYLQHLAPWHLEQAVANLPTDVDTRHWTAMPNFVNTNLYRPVANDGERRALRKQFGLPEDAFICGTAAAIKKHHKRIDYLLQEFARIPNRQMHLVVAGSRQPDTRELQELAEQLAPGHVSFFVNHPHGEMPDLLRCFDCFVLPSLFEMMPIALLEAISTALPVVTNCHPVLEWMGGAGGMRIDMSGKGALAETLESLTREACTHLGAAARQHAVEHFSEEAVVTQYLEYYQRILSL